LIQFGAYTIHSLRYFVGGVPRHVFSDGIPEQLVSRPLSTPRKPFRDLEYIIGNGNGGFHTFSMTSNIFGLAEN